MGYAKFCSETLYFALNVLVFAVHNGAAILLSLQFTKGSHFVVEDEVKTAKTLHASCSWFHKN